MIKSFYRKSGRVRLQVVIAVACCFFASKLVAAEQPELLIHWNAKPDDDLLKVGKFDTWTPKSAWKNIETNARIRTSGYGIVSLDGKGMNNPQWIETELDLPDGLSYLTFMVRLRGPGLTKLPDSKPIAGVQFTLEGEEARVLPPIEPSYSGYRDWGMTMRTTKLRPTERKLRIRIQVDNVEGTLDVDNILVVPSDPKAEATPAQRHVFSAALKKDDDDAVERLIRQFPHMLEVRMGSYDNGTPLIGAAREGAPKVAAKLIDLGADVEARDSNWHNTPLRWCCWFGIPEVTEVLLKAGAKTTGTAVMAQSSKTQNRFTKRSAEDFDRVVELITSHEASDKTN